MVSISFLLLVEEETTFTSVSQIKPIEESIVPHPPASKKDGKKRSPRKMAMADRSANRHIDGIRQHHEQRFVRNLRMLQNIDQII